VDVSVLGFHSSTADVSTPLWYKITLLWNWFLMNSDNTEILKCQEPISQWCGITSQKNGWLKVLRRREYQLYMKHPVISVHPTYNQILCHGLLNGRWSQLCKNTLSVLQFSCIFAQTATFFPTLHTYINTPSHVMLQYVTLG